MAVDLTDQKQVDEIISQLEEKKFLHVELTDGGLLRIDRPSPYLLVYRIPSEGKDYFTYQLGKTESSYMMVADMSDELLNDLLHPLVKSLSDRFGSFLLLETWVSDKTKAHDFTIHINDDSAAPVADVLQKNLNFRLGRDLVTSEVVKVAEIHPPRLEPLISVEEADKIGCLSMGLEIKPSYINQSTGKAYPLYVRELRIAFGKALKKAFFEFVRLHTSFNASHFEMLGTTVVDDLVWEIDARLAQYSNQFDFLLLTTPVNMEEAWKDFVESGFQKAPAFHYRRMPIDPEIIKRKIFDLPIEKITDPTLAFLFRDKRKEIDRMLNMMIDREKPDFLQSSIQLYGQVDEDLLDVSKGLLAATPIRKKQDVVMMDCQEFVKLAEQELHYLKDQHPEVDTFVNVREDIEGIFVSRGVLFVNQAFTVERRRAFALLQHEVGTHVATYYNGKSQPLQLFHAGVPGYEQLQEGLAVLSEFLVGGLTNNRLRTLAARVVAVNQLLTGHRFVDTFFLLTDKYQFSPATAFSITMRVYRGGGLTKDAVYMKGLIHLLAYLREGKEIMPLLIGKIRQDYIPVIEELTHRKLLNPIPIRPRYLTEEYAEPLARVKAGLTVFNLIQDQ